MRVRVAPGGDEGGAALLVGGLEVGPGLDEHIQRLELPCKPGPARISPAP